jgi:type IV secretion system protein VirB10
MTPGGPGVVPRRVARLRRLTSPLVVASSVVAVLAAFATWRILYGGPLDPAPLDAQANPVHVTRVQHRDPVALPEARDLPAPMVLPPAPMPVAMPVMPVQAPVLAQPENGPLVTTYEPDAPVRPPPVALASAPAGPAGPRGGVEFRPLQMAGAASGVVTDLTNTIRPTTRALCTLDQALDSSTPGSLVCHLAHDVLGWDNSRVLIPKGTPVLGSYQGLNTGQGRLTAIAAHAFRSDGVVIPLGAPFTDDLGRTGIPGEVDTHFWARFGNALLMDVALAMVQLPQAALTSRQPGTTNLNFNAGSSEGVVSEVLRNSVNIPPTLRRNQGEDVMLLIIQPIQIGEVRMVGR